MRKTTLIVILCLAGFSALQVVLHMSGTDDVDWAREVQTVTEDTFDVAVDRARPWVVVKVWAPWCGVCKRMKPLYNQAAGEFDDSIDFFSLDSEAEPGWADTYRVEAPPTLIVFHRGQEIARHTGYFPAEALRNWLTHTTGMESDTP